jgi:hypothetical protein
VDDEILEIFQWTGIRVLMARSIQIGAASNQAFTPVACG